MFRFLQSISKNKEKENIHILSSYHPISSLYLFPSQPDFFKNGLRMSANSTLLLLLPLLSRFSPVWLCATPQTAAHQAPPSLGFSRQEHWSGLPFPSPMHKNEKWKGSHSVVSDSSRPHGLQPTRLLRLWDFPGKSTGVGCHCLVQTVPYDTSKPQRVIIPLEEGQGSKTWGTLLYSELKTRYMIFFTWFCFLASFIEIASSHHKIVGVFISLIYNLYSQGDLAYSLSLTEN